MFTENMIAPCGLDCSLCSEALKQENPCAGCLGPSENKPEFCSTLCTIITCEKLTANSYRFCTECDDYPCEFCQERENRYRTQYAMRESPLGNLQEIQRHGMERFLEQQRKTWTCKACDGIICVHTGICSGCGATHTAKDVEN